MINYPKTQEEWTLHALNIHGIFFERLCQKIISECKGWNIRTTNYPVEFPPPNGPIRGKESALDIRAEKYHTFDLVTLLIECKKNNPEFVNWVFFEKQTNNTTNTFITACVENKKHPPPMGGRYVDTTLQSRPMPFRIVNEGREIRGDYANYQGGNKTKTSNTAIQDAAYQVTLATQAIVIEDAQISRTFCITGGAPELTWNKQFYIPTIVTTAKLFVCEFNEANVDPATGEISYSKASLKEVEALIYEYAIPKHLQHPPVNIVDTIKEDKIEIYIRKHILVTNSQHLKKFLDLIYSKILLMGDYTTTALHPEGAGEF